MEEFKSNLEGSRWLNDAKQEMLKMQEKGVRFFAHHPGRKFLEWGEKGLGINTIVFDPNRPGDQEVVAKDKMALRAAAIAKINSMVDNKYLYGKPNAAGRMTYSPRQEKGFVLLDPGDQQAVEMVSADVLREDAEKDSSERSGN